MTSKELSVIFPIYNEEKTIKKTLLEWKSVLNKLSINYEMIIAEDGSTDKTSYALDLFCDPKNSIINVINNEQ